MAFTKLPGFPRNRLLHDELARCRASELDLLARFGAPTGELPGDREPTLYWDLEWDCGLVADLQLRQISQVLSVHLDEHEVDHLLRHLGFPVRELWLAFSAPADHEYEVWADDERVATSLSERDARCWCDDGEGVNYRYLRAGR